MKNFLLFSLLTIALGLNSQNIHLYRTIYFPAEPAGGQKELEDFVKQEMHYPDEALEADMEGKVFITFMIDPKGKVKYKKLDDGAPELLQEEASRIFDHIIWVADPRRNEDELGYEKLEIAFATKKYKKLARKRGYHHLPYDSSLTISKRLRPYAFNEVDEKPQITNAKTVNEFVSSNFKYPSIAKERNISGRVAVEMVIEPYGMASNVKVTDPVAGGCNEETVRLVKAMRWKPAMVDGEAVRSYYKYQLNFVNPGGTIR